MTNKNGRDILTDDGLHDVVEKIEVDGMHHGCEHCVSKESELGFITV